MPISVASFQCLRKRPSIPDRPAFFLGRVLQVTLFTQGSHSPVYHLPYRPVWWDRPLVMECFPLITPLPSFVVALCLPLSFQSSSKITTCETEEYIFHLEWAIYKSITYIGCMNEDSWKSMMVKPQATTSYLTSILLVGQEPPGRRKRRALLRCHRREVGMVIRDCGYYGWYQL